MDQQEKINVLCLEERVKLAIIHKDLKNIITDLLRLMIPVIIVS